MSGKPLIYEGSTPAQKAIAFDVALQCPRCRKPLDSLYCVECSFELKLRDGIVHALPPERVEYFSRFITDYEHIRAAEGRGSQQRDYYLRLPYEDVSGNNSGQWKIRARSFDYLFNRILRRENLCKSLLDLGAGNCWMSYRLARAGYQTTSVDLLTNDQDGLGAASHYEAELSRSLPRFQAELAHLPFQDEQFDAVVFNASFHYSEDYVSTLQEAFRCLKPQGLLIISDTPWYANEASGNKMVQERQEIFARRFGTASASVPHLEYLTDARLRLLEEALSIRWEIHKAWYGFQWAMRPLIAKFKRRRAPSRFRLYVARKGA